MKYQALLNLFFPLGSDGNAVGGFPAPKVADDSMTIDSAEIQ